MAEKIEVIPFGYKIKSSGKTIFDMHELYKALIYWFEYNHYEWKETSFLNEEQPGGGKHIEITWECIKNVSPYINFVIKLEFLLFLGDVEIEMNGKKIKKDIGSVEVRTGATIIKGESWEKSKGITFLRNVYERYLIRERIENYKKDLYTEAHKLYDEIKAFLEMHRYKENV